MESNLKVEPPRQSKGTKPFPNDRKA
jgi:hypothetical protein